MLRIGILQEEFAVEPRVNLDKIYNWLTNRYKEADLIVLPEYSMINVLEGLKPEDVYLKAEFIDDSFFLSKLSDYSSIIGAPILAHFIEKTHERPRCLSSSVFVKPSGGLERVYSKIHLFDAYGYRESDFFKPGEEFSKPIVLNNVTLYVAICYDMRFPELFRIYAYSGASGVIVQAGWVRGPLKERILDTLASTRSHENTMYLILVNQTGGMFTGRSGVFNPYGYKEVDLGFKPKYVEYGVDFEELAEARKLIPVVRQAKDRWRIEKIATNSPLKVSL